MNERAKRRSFSRALLFLLVLPLLVLASVAYLVLPGGGEAGLELARGSTGGAFHPVAGNFAPDDTKVDDCGEREFRCLEQAFGNVAYRLGPKAALALFDARIASDADVRGRCHTIAHNIGSAAFALFDGNVATTFSRGSATCASGYYHGVLERAFVGVTSKTELVAVARELCSGGALRRHGFLDYQCRHGLGHGLMIQTGYDLPLALDVCGGLATRWDGAACAGGVFMENANTSFGYRSRWVDEEDPLHPCNRVATRFRRTCYLRVPTRLLQFHRKDFAKTADACAKLDPRWASPCFRGYGRDAVTEAGFVPDKTVSFCRLAGPWSGDCWRGAARTVGDRAGLTAAKRAAQFCSRSPRAERGSCFAGVGINVGLLHHTHEARRRACAGLAAASADSCASAAIAAVDPNGRGAFG